MAFAAVMGVDFAFSFVTMASALLPLESKPVAQIGIGSTAFGATTDARTNGVTPNLFLYDVGGKKFAKHGSGDPIEDKANRELDFIVLEGNEKDTSPEYLTIQARTDDATCVSYVTVTGAAAGDERTWHAGYVKKCAEILGDSSLWYPSPDKIPGTEYRPGCVWLSRDDRFLQGISVHLPSFGFPDSDQAEDMNKQYDSFTDTLCKAPARQALYKKMGGTDCIPFYDFEYKKNTTTNFDLDFQRIVDGHKLPERCDYSVNQLLNQELQPGKGPRTETPESRAAAAALKEKEEEERLAAEEERLLAEEEERQRLAEEQELNEAGLNPDGAPPGTGSFGGVVGSIPISKADSAARKKRQIQSQHRNSATTLLVRREQLRAAGNHCVDRLTISHHAEHSARELCEMNNSWGPDFVAVEERLYCDMCERELYPTCEHAGQENCFDVETRKVKGRGVSERDGGPVASLDKDYVDVQVWEV